MKYRQWIEESSKRNKSNIILALDVIESREHLLKKCLSLIRDLSSLICAIKINQHTVLSLGLHNGVQEIISLAHSFELPVIIDCKINDIGSMNEVITKNYFEAGFDAITANPFVGWEDGLKPVFEIARDMEKGVLLLVYMSHKGADEGYGQLVTDMITGNLKPQYEVFAEKAQSWNADGVIVGATRPNIISRVYSIVKDRIPIYSPGIGVQGGEIELALKAGARYLIIGRSIVSANAPVSVASNFLKICRAFSTILR